MLTQIHPEIGLTGPNEELKQNDAKWIWWLVVQEKSFRPTMVCYGMLAHSGVQHFTAVWLWHITCIGENNAEATSLSLSPGGFEEACSIEWTQTSRCAQYQTRKSGILQVVTFPLDGVARPFQPESWLRVHGSDLGLHMFVWNQKHVVQTARGPRSSKALHI